MKEIFFAFILTFILISTSDAQDNMCMKADNGYVILSGGPCMPVGNFGNKDFSSKASGFAETGYKIDLNGEYHLIKSLDISAKCFYSLFNYNVSGLINSYSAQYPGTTWNSIGRDWELIGGLAGFSYSHPFGKAFIANGKILCGVMNSSAPDLNLTAGDGSSYFESKRSATSFTYLFSVGGIYPIGNLIDLAANVEYINAAPTFKNVNFKFVPFSGTAVTSNSDLKQDISLLAFDIGVRVRF